MRVPAVCDNCSTIFPSSFELKSINTSFYGCTSGPCPICGSTGHILDGVYSFVENTILLLNNSNKTKNELQKLIDILKEAKNKGQSINEIANKISSEAPELSSIKEILPKSRSEFYAFISILITIIGLFINLTSNKHDKKIEVNQIINNFYQQNIIENNISIKLDSLVNKPKIGVNKKIGRNQLCPCKSGKKYKDCHGK
jgi:hypothetical protein